MNSVQSAATDVSTDAQPQVAKHLSGQTTEQSLDALHSVIVLMSTYNGERYVFDQLQSILPQLPETGKIIVRDDGSTDQTAAKVVSCEDSRITLILGENLGFGASFLTLLQFVPSGAEMVMFADQDDIWLPGKIERAQQFLRPLSGQPALYGSAQTLVDANLNQLGATAPWKRGPSLSSALTENIITGCTAALNQKAVALLQYAGSPKQIYFHDWWSYLVVSAFGIVVHDNESRILYRQHSNNQIGHGIGWIGRQLGILRFLVRHDWVGIMLGQVHALSTVFANQLPSNAKTLVSRYYEIDDLRATVKWRLIVGSHKWRQTWRQEILFRILVAAHKLTLWPTVRRRR